MSRTVGYYEKKFDEVYTEFQKALDIKNGGHVPGGDVFSDMVARSMLSVVPKRTTPEMTAAITILKEYTEKKPAHHKEEASLIASILALLMTDGNGFIDACKQNRTVMGLFVLAVLPTIGFTNTDEKLTEEQKKVLNEELPKQLVSPSKEVQKNLVKVLISSVIEEADLALHKSDFASVSFVLVKRLNLEVTKAVMEKIIQGANFSQGFLYCGSANSRRAEELANLSKYSVPESKKPAMELKQ